eukprot:scaffold242649_cov29-Tisochrysis_lutea.AAC.3
MHAARVAHPARIWAGLMTDDSSAPAKGQGPRLVVQAHPRGVSAMPREWDATPPPLALCDVTIATRSNTLRLLVYTHGSTIELRGDAVTEQLELEPAEVINEKFGILLKPLSPDCSDLSALHQI